MPKRVARKGHSSKAVAPKAASPKNFSPKRIAAKNRSKAHGFQPSAAQRQMVQALAGWGVARGEIARSIAPGGMSLSSLRRHFADELASGRTMADAAIAETLIDQARQGNVAACKLWIERAGRGGEAKSGTDAFTAEISRARQTLERKLARLAAHCASIEVSS
jgi:hypothetical protein